jgi:hypothetical protein
MPLPESLLFLTAPLIKSRPAKRLTPSLTLSLAVQFSTRTFWAIWRPAAPTRMPP